ncbi:MAG: ketoacyl-ACP synthase III [Alphaproteobacteria bacterium]|nr:ketoacyl-ACP synthase III [Alphaproteobacteria bacterium]MBV9063328.1 ketoacyl-ACP synthase III [Alphaproteobacteria bacterium]
MTVIRSQIVGCGSFLPDRILTNAELASRLDTSDEWIASRTGIRRRHIAGDGERTTDLALKAAQRALKDADLPVEEIDLVICATTTPDETFPSVASAIQARIGMTRGAAFDVQAVCSGFIYGLAVADNFIKARQAKTVLLIGAETMSRLMDWTDRTTCVLFGDGAGAVVLRGSKGRGIPSERGVLNTKLYSDGRLHDLLYVDGGPSTTGTTGHLRMLGKEVFKHAVINIADSIESSVEDSGISISEIDWFVPHQANQRILEATARRLKVPGERFISTISDHGNTSAASVPLALDVAVRDGRIKQGDVVMLEAMGGGLTWGAALLRW